MPLAVFGLLGALAIGVALGPLGSGGSIITVPVLVYLFGQDEKQAVAGSLLVVGVIACAGVLGYLRRRAVDARAIGTFGVPGAFGTFIGAWLSRFVPGAAQLVLFAVTMLIAAVVMLRGSRRAAKAMPSVAVAESSQDAVARPSRAAIAPAVAVGIAVGGLTGLIGVGGGFLIVPALVSATKLDMTRAVGTSLGVIALNCAVGFVKHSTTLEAPLDWTTLAIVAAIGIAGSHAGQRFGAKLPQATLRRIFGVMLLVMGAAILIESGPRALTR